MITDQLIYLAAGLNQARKPANLEDSAAGGIQQNITDALRSTLVLMLGAKDGAEAYTSICVDGESVRDTVERYSPEADNG